MSEWKEYRLGDILSIKSGFSYKGKYIGKGDSLLLGMGCVSFKEKFLMSGARPYSGPFDDRYKVYSGDIVLATRQQSDNLPILAMPAIVPDSLEGKDIVIGTNLYKVEITDYTFSNVFIYWLLKTKQYVNYIAGVKTGTTVSMVTKKNVEDFTFLAPTNPKEREEIVSIISALDDKIAVNRRICENLEAQAQALFKHWFIDFAPFKNGKFVESELGMIPEGWRVGKFTDIFDLGSGGTPKTSEKLYWEDGSIPFFSPKDVNGVYCFETEKHITEKGLNNCSSSLYSKNTVFITCRGTVGKVAMAAVPMAMNQSNYAILSNKGYSQHFAYLMTVSIVKKLKFKANGAVFDAITSKDFKEQIIIPNLNIVNRFDSIIQPIFDCILNIGFENLRLSTLRATLLPKLMSGQIKV